MSACVPTTTERLARRDGLERLGLARRALSEPVSSVDADADALEQRADGLEVLAGEQVGRREERALEPGPGRAASA